MGCYWVGADADWRKSTLGKAFNDLSPNDKGKLGEQATKDLFTDKGYQFGERHEYTVDGRDRISDGSLFRPTDENKALFTGIPEAKAKISQSHDLQIKDAIKYTKDSSLEYHTVTLSDTKLSRPLQPAIADNSHVFLHRLSPEQVFKAGVKLSFW